MSKHTQHTPGPWTFGRIRETAMFDIIGPNITGRGRELVGTLHATQNRRVDESNARLIAAAPDLLEALRYIAGLDTSQDASPAQCSAVAVAMDAIAKAEGGAS